MSLATRAALAVCRSSRVTEGDWFDLIEERRRAIIPILDSIGLPDLRRVLVWTREPNDPEPVIDAPTPYSLKTRGLFEDIREQDEMGARLWRIPGWPKAKQYDNEYYRLPRQYVCWGIAQDGKWLVVRINATPEGETKLGVTAITITPVDSAREVLAAEAEVCAPRGPQSLHSWLGQQVCGLHLHRKRLLEEVARVREEFNGEDALLLAVSQAHNWVFTPTCLGED